MVGLAQMKGVRILRRERLFTRRWYFDIVLGKMGLQDKTA